MVLLGLLLAMWLPVASEDVVLEWRGLSLPLHVSGTLIVGLVLAALAGTGMDAVARPLFAPGGRLGERIPLWVLPACTAVAALLALGDLWWGYQLGIIALTGLTLATVMVAQYHAADQASPHRPLARVVVQVMAYAAALVLFVSLYGTRIRGALLGTGALLLGFGLGLVLLSGGEARTRRVWLYAAIVGLTTGQLMLALNYFLLDERLAGALLLLVFYASAGLAQQQLWQRLTRRVVLEYATILLVGVGVIALLNRWMAL